MPEVREEIIDDSEVHQVGEVDPIAYMYSIDLLHEGCEVLGIERKLESRQTRVIFSHSHPWAKE